MSPNFLRLLRTFRDIADGAEYRVRCGGSIYDTAYLDAAMDWTREIARDHGLDPERVWGTLTVAAHVGARRADNAEA